MAFAAGPNKYQATGPVWKSRRMRSWFKKVATSGNSRDAATKVSGDLKVGAKVTIEYTMTVTKIDVKEDKRRHQEKEIIISAP